MLRVLRRLVLRYFGGVKKFLLFVCLFVSGIVFVHYSFSNNAISTVIGFNHPTMSDESDYNATTVTTPVYICADSDLCSANKSAYYVRSGHGVNQPAIICYDGQRYIGDKVINGRGINLVVINEHTMAVESVRTFDTFESGTNIKDSALNKFLKSQVTGNSIILLTTQDECTRSLSPDTRNLLHFFGSTLVDKLQFRENFALVGQRSLSRGSAVETHSPRSFAMEYGDAVELSGCLTSPMGRLTDVSPRTTEHESAAINESESYCGLTKTCGPDSFPVRLYTGNENVDLPRICVNGDYVEQRLLGRGINLVIVNSTSRNITRMENFDTYTFSNTTIEAFLSEMKEGDILLAVTHDEATIHLDDTRRELFKKYGSFYLKQLAMRDAWCFVGQFGMVGRSPLEEVEFAPLGAMRWSRPIDMRTCVPSVVKGLPIGLQR